MMQLLCNNTALDLYDNAGLQFTQPNPLFAFDELKCERSTEFKIPATTNNDRVLSLARIPAYNGEGMRRKFPSKLISGTLVMDGYLYISSFDGKDYKGVFVTGELVGLQRIKDRGKVKDYLYYNSAYMWDNSTQNADEATLSNIGVVAYSAAVGQPVYPSVSVEWILNEMLAGSGVQIDWTNAANARRYRIIKQGKLKVEENRVLLEAHKDDPQEPISIVGLFGVSQSVPYFASTWYATAINDGGIEWDTNNAVRTDTRQIQEWQFDAECSISFPIDTPNTYFIASGNIAQNAAGKYGRTTFIGGWGINEWGQTYGTPLAGRKVIIPANTPFVIIDGRQYLYPTPQSVGDTAIIGYDFVGQAEYALPVTMSITKEYVKGENIPYNALLPSCTAIDIIKAIAATSGTLLNFSNNTIVFENINTQTAPIHNISNIISMRDVARTFYNYAQVNNIRFDSSELVLNAERLVVNYYIANENIAQTKELQKLAFSEGGVSVVLRGDGELIPSLYTRVGDESTILAHADTSQSYMLRVGLYPVLALQELCARSTQVHIECRMTLQMYRDILPTTILLLDGLRYMWTERSWQNDTAKFTISRV